jgi:hypothetical protein
MKTVIDNSLRVFQITDSLGNQYFCNLSDISKIVKERNLNEGYFKIFHFWNNKPQKVSKKYLSELLKANQLTQDFFY